MDLTQAIKDPYRGTYLDSTMPRFPTGCCVSGRGQQQWIKGDCMWGDGTCLGNTYQCEQKRMQDCPTVWYEVHDAF